MPFWSFDYTIQQNELMFSSKEKQAMLVNLNVPNLSLSLNIFYYTPFSGERKW